MTNLDSILKSRDILLTKVHIAKAMVFPVVVYRCKSWTIKKAEHQRTNAFKLRVPWTARRSNQSILKEINSECSLEELMLKMNLHYFGHLMQRANSLENTLMLGKFEGRKSKGMTEDEMVGWHHWRKGHESDQALEDGERQGRVAKSWTQPSN